MSDYIQQLERDNEALSSNVEKLAKELEEAKFKLKKLENDPINQLIRKYGNIFEKINYK